MRAHFILLAAGALCLPATYHFTRQGSLVVSIALIITIAALGTWVALYVNRADRHAPWWTLAFAFCGGAVVSETIFFAHYYFDYGYADRKLSVGITLSLIESGVIALVGGLGVAAAYFSLRRITST